MPSTPLSKQRELVSKGEFAMVADEVRKLAELITASTGGISKMLEEEVPKWRARGRQTMAELFERILAAMHQTSRVA